MPSASPKGIRGADLNNLLNLIKVWIDNESGPTATFSMPRLQVRVSIRGYKKIILERTFDPKVKL